LIYEKGFIPTREDKLEINNSLLIETNTIRDRKFVSGSKLAIQFAVSQFEKSLEEVHGKCTYFADLNYPDIVKETIRVTGLKYKAGPEKPKLILLDFVESRYSGSRKKDDVLQFVRAQLDNKPVLLEAEIYDMYTELFPGIRMSFGLPEIFLERK